MKVDYSLYLVTDRDLSRGRTNFQIINSAIKGGVTTVQLREKRATTRRFLKEALAIREFCHDNNVTFIINDSIDIALAVDADGVHVGQDDMPIEYARRILGHDKIIGVSAFDEKEALEAEKAGADYIGVAPIFLTPTKPELDKCVGLDGLKRIRRAVNIPLVAIGGLGPSNAFDTIKAGANGIAVVSAIVSADDPEEVARAIKAEVKKARGEKA